MLTLDARKTALVVIDLQEGILPFAGGRTQRTKSSAAPLRRIVHGARRLVRAPRR